MKKLLFIPFIALLSCNNVGNQTTSQNPSNTVLVIVLDNSASYVRRCPKVNAPMLKPLCTRITKTSSIDIRIGRVTANSDTEFLRYSQQKIIEQTQDNNPWLNAGNETQTNEAEAQWHVFAAQLEQITKPAKQSDIGGCLSHSLLIFQEYPHGSRKILLLATDYKNNGLPMPAIDPDIEVMNIGALPNIPIEKLLHTQNVKRFESLQTAIEFISSTFKN